MNNSNSRMPIETAIKDVDGVPVEVNVNTVMPTGMTDALATANAVTKELIHTTLDRLAATSPEQAAKITRISLVQTFSVTPNALHLDIEIKK